MKTPFPLDCEDGEVCSWAYIGAEMGCLNLKCAVRN